MHFAIWEFPEVFAYSPLLVERAMDVADELKCSSYSLETLNETNSGPPASSPSLYRTNLVDLG